MNKKIRTSAILAALAVMIAGITPLVTAPQAQAAQMYKVTAAANIRSGPGTGYSSLGTAQAGLWYLFDCYALGTSVFGNNVWGHLQNGGYIADYYISLGSSGKTLKSIGMPQCNSSGQPSGTTAPGWGHGIYQNGSSQQPVYSTTDDAYWERSSIGSLDKYEAVWCYGKVNGYYLVEYKVGNYQYKVGFVKWAATVGSVRTSGVAWQNGSTPEKVYHSYYSGAGTQVYNPAWQIGTLTPGTKAQAFAGQKGVYLIVYDISGKGTNYKAGWVAYNGGLKG